MVPLPDSTFQWHPNGFTGCLPKSCSDSLPLTSLSLTSLTSRSGASPVFHKISGFGNKSFRKGCFPLSWSLKKFRKNLLETKCLALWGTRGSNVKLAGTHAQILRFVNTYFIYVFSASAIDTIVWTDNKNAVLIVPCNQESNILDWFVLTKRPKISESVQESVCKMVAKLGFNLANAVYYDYQHKKIFRPGVK